MVPSPSQLRRLLTSAPEMLYAGPKGLGKSTAVLVTAVAKAASGGVALAVVPELASSPLPGLIQRWLASAQPEVGGRSWRLPGGGRVALAHRRAHPSGPFRLAAVDDLCRLREPEYLDLLGPGARVMAAASPEEPGREWVAARFGLEGGERPPDRVVVTATLGEIPGGEVTRRALERLPEPRRSWALGDWSAGTSTPEPAWSLDSRRAASVSAGGDPPAGDDRGAVEGVAFRLGFDGRGSEVVWEPEGWPIPTSAPAGSREPARPRPGRDWRPSCWTSAGDGAPPRRCWPGGSCVESIASWWAAPTTPHAPPAAASGRLAARFDTSYRLRSDPAGGRGPGSGGRHSSDADPTRAAERAFAIAGVSR